MRFHLIAAVAALTLMATQSFALSANFSDDFSITNSNPNGAWTYGYTTSLGGSFTAYTDTAATSTHQVWYMPGLSGDNTPSVFKNISGSGINGVPGGSTALHSGPGGQLSVARYTSSENTDVTIDGFFGAGDIGNVGVYIFVNGVQEFGVESTTSEELFSLSASLLVGSTIDFVVGNGFSGYSFDSTPLTATIETVPEPATMVALGLAGAALVRRRRAR